MASWIINLSCLFRQLVIRHFKISTLLSLPVTLFYQGQILPFPCHSFHSPSLKFFKKLRLSEQGQQPRRGRRM